MWAWGKLFQDSATSQRRWRPSSMPSSCRCVRLADSPERGGAAGKNDALIARVPVVEFDSGAAEGWADIFATLHRAGTPIAANDLAVAATALELLSECWLARVTRRILIVFPVFAS